MRAVTLSALLVLALSACSSWFGDKKPSVAVEPNVLPANYRAKLLEFLKGHLADPVGVREAAITEPRLQVVAADSRYVVCVRFNSKNAYGEYVGLKEHIAIYFAGNLTQFVPASPGQCGNAAYQPFPELERLAR